MDRELIEYFDRRFDQVNRRFDEASRRFDETNEETNRRFDQVDRRFDETNEETNRRFDQVDRRFDETNEETNRRFDEVDRRFEKTDQRIDALRHDMNDGLRQNRILLEDLKGKVDLVIEGAMGFREELKRDVADVRGEVREIQTRLEVGYVLLDRQHKAGGVADV